MSRLYIGSINKAKEIIREEFPKAKLVFVENALEVSKSFSIFFDNDKIFIHCNPNLESLKVISSDIDNNKGKHFLHFDDDSYDGRNSLIQKIKKQGSIFDCSFPIFGDTNSFKRQLQNICKKYGCVIEPTCIDWLCNNSPIYKVKSKSANSKKEIMVYDLDIIDAEIFKISTVSKNITINSFEDSLFNSESDIFDFIESLLSGDISRSYEMLSDIVEAFTDQGMLLILLSQLHFLLVVTRCKERNIYDSNKVLSIVECDDILGKYLSEDFIYPLFTKKTQNPIRINIELNKRRNLTSSQISSYISLVVDCIVDLRDQGNKNIVLPYLVSKFQCV